jgi:hypothetical protein
VGGSHKGNWSHILRCEGTKFKRTKFWTRGLGILMQKYLLGGNKDARIQINGRK